jgi:hypothetical protein
MSQPIKTIVLMQSSGKYAIHRKMFSSECAISMALSRASARTAIAKDSDCISMNGRRGTWAWVSINLLLWRLGAA